MGQENSIINQRRYVKIVSAKEFLAAAIFAD